MAAKRAKLLDQFHDTNIVKESNIFNGIAIHVNGLTKPPIEVLKHFMAAHGGAFHAYQVSTTTHIIASNLANVKVSLITTYRKNYISQLYIHAEQVVHTSLL